MNVSVEKFNELVKLLEIMAQKVKDNAEASIEMRGVVRQNKKDIAELKKTSCNNILKDL